MASLPPSELTGTRRLPRLEDFPEAGPNALATFQQRGYARIADELIIWFPLTIIVSTVQASQSETVQGELPLAVLIGVFVVQILYEVVGVSIWGQTVGKWLTGIRVARYTDGGRPTVAQSLLRCLLWGAPAAAGLVLLPFAPLAGAVPVFLSAWRYPLRRAWHDEAGGTIVVRTR
jgi:uncharacterized RDD family membrane protein YckC